MALDVHVWRAILAHGVKQISTTVSQDCAEIVDYVL